MSVDGGAARFSEPATAVEVGPLGYQVVQTGIVGQRTIEQLASTIVMFVCTGNTCRSPMAEVMFRNLVCKHLDCTDDELVSRGYLVLSAGLATSPGMPASAESLHLMRESGLDLSCSPEPAGDPRPPRGGRLHHHHDPFTS
ncbi:MAG: hypothetical protein R3B90_23525 [Planctomycetaceae bacterium]